ncbi:MAG TPA: hypothetical protein VIB79_27570 [Candidatus Binatia bacterium]|jgi:hypothetical protein
MFDIDRLLQLGVFNQLIPVWQVLFLIASLVPFLLLNRVKICLLIVYLYTFYLGFLVQWGDYIASLGSMQPFIIYSLCGIAIAVFFVVTMFSEPEEKTNPAWVRQAQVHPVARQKVDPIEMAMNITDAQ